MRKSLSRPRTVYLGRHGSPESQIEYGRLIQSLAEGKQQPQDVSKLRHADITVAELAVAYLRHAQGYYTKAGEPTNEVNRIRLVVQRMSQLFGSSLASEFTPLMLKAIRQSWIDDGRTRRRINQEVGVVRRAFKWAVESMLVSPSVPHGLQAVAPLKLGRTEAKEADPILPVAEAHIEAIRPFVSRQVWSMIHLQRLTGCRPGEIVIMRGCDLNSAGEIWEYRPARHKTEHHGRDRLILLGPQAQAILRPWLRDDPLELLFQPIEADRERREQLTRQRKTPAGYGNRPGTNRQPRPERKPGTRYKTTSYAKTIADACQRAGIPRWEPNQLRHLAATTIRREHGLESAQVVLGHARADVTQIYAEANREKAVAVIAKIG